LASADDRALARRDQILRAALVARIEKGCGATVADVVSIAGVGRNTFYELFDDVEHAVGAAEDVSVGEIERELDRATNEARTPIDRLRRLSGAWLTVVSAHGDFVRSVVERERPVPDRLGAALRARLSETLTIAKEAGAIAQRPEGARLIAVTGAFRAVALEIAQSGRTDVSRDAEILVDVTLRAFR
jgi:AcrR family transcriptional regulator